MVNPAPFLGGPVSEYVVEILKNGGYGTRHVPTGRLVPHVLAPHGIGQIAGTALQAAAPWLAAANLGVGLLNLGVSAWTAWKVHKMDKKLDGLEKSIGQLDGRFDQLGGLLEQSTTHLDRLIRNNSSMLEEILEHHGELDRVMVLVRDDIARGFQSMERTVASVEATREARELEQQMRTLFHYYQLCTSELREGREPPPSDLRRIVDVAATLLAWLDTRLAATPVGRPERFPFLVARAFTLRLEIEARQLLEEAPDARTKELERSRDVVRAEVKTLTEGATLFELASERGALIRQYVYLQRSLGASATLVELPDGSVTPCYPTQLLEWDDGLSSVRELAYQRDDVGAPSRFELRTLEEHRTLQRLVGLPRGATADVVEATVVSRALGIPDSFGVSEPRLRALLHITPAVLSDAKSRIERAVA